LLQGVLFDQEVLFDQLILEGHLFQEILLLPFLLEVLVVLAVLALPYHLSHQSWDLVDHDLLWYLVSQENQVVLEVLKTMVISKISVYH
jgi:hypothetical protein